MKKETMMIRKSNDRGLADHGWLKSRHTFSFSEYYDPEQMGFGVLRVINEDRIAGGTGFGTHPHADMEIISYVISGGLKHQDSMGNQTVILPGEVQRMSAGTGVRHSEFNQQENQETHFLQIWIIPNKKGLKPGYGQKSFEQDLSEKEMVLVISEFGKDGSISINQDANIFISRLKTGKEIKFNNQNDRRTWIQVIRGKVLVNNQNLEAGDAAGITDELELTVKSSIDTELMIFDLPV